MNVSHNGIKPILGAQIGIIAVATILVWRYSAVIALSILIGGLICFLPNVYLAYKLTVKRSAQAAQVMRVMYGAEFGKIFITAALFAVVFATQAWIHPLALLGGFMVAQLTHWITPLLFNSGPNNNQG